MRIKGSHVGAIGDAERRVRQTTAPEAREAMAWRASRVRYADVVAVDAPVSDVPDVAPDLAEQPSSAEEDLPVVPEILARTFG